MTEIFQGATDSSVSNAGNVFSQVFNVDELGNRTSVATDDDGVGSNSPSSESYTANVMNEYTAVGSTSITYDDNGNILNNGTYAFAYDYRNQVVSVTGTSLAVGFEYDVFGRRTEKIVNGVSTFYYYDGMQVVEEYSSSTATNFDKQYVYGGGIDMPLWMRTTTATYHYFQDAQGNVRSMVDDSGNIVEHYEYDAYGDVTIYDGSGNVLTASSVGNEFFFTGRRYDSEIDLYYYRARYYDASMGRFISRDPLGYYDSMNLYEYVGGNPGNYTDPLGLYWYNGQEYAGPPSPFVNSGDYISKRPKHDWSRTIFLAITGLDIVDDLRSLELNTYNAIDNYQRYGAIGGDNSADLLMDGISLIPAIGALKYTKYTDEAVDTAKIIQRHGDEIVNSVRKNIDEVVQAVNRTKSSQIYDTITKQIMVPGARSKLDNVASVTGRSTNSILKNASTSTNRYIDTLNNGNINIWIDNTINPGNDLIRITTNPEGTRIISAGFNNSNQVENAIQSGRFIFFNN